MAPDTLNAVSQAIGALQAEVKNLREDGEARDRKLDRIIHELGVVPQLIRDVGEMRPAVTDLMRLRNQGVGVLAMVGLLGSVIGATVSLWGHGLMRWLSGGPS